MSRHFAHTGETHTAPATAEPVAADSINSLLQQPLAAAVLVSLLAVLLIAAGLYLLHKYSPWHLEMPKKGD